MNWVRTYTFKYTYCSKIGTRCLLTPSVGTLSDLSVHVVNLIGNKTN